MEYSRLPVPPEAEMVIDPGSPFNDIPVVIEAIMGGGASMVRVGNVSTHTLESLTRTV
jgi:hypothetical protein